MPEVQEIFFGSNDIETLQLFKNIVLGVVDCVKLVRRSGDW